MNLSPGGTTRRQAIRSLVGGSMLLPGLLGELLAEPPGAKEDPLAPKRPHYPARAKRVIFLYMTGGSSHLDTFDPKPRLDADHGKSYPVPGKKGMTKKLKRNDYRFRRYGRCGTPVSELFPNVGECVDDLCVIRSMHTNHRDHVEASLGIHTGSVTVTRPSIGSWVSYGLGTFNTNLPSFIVIAPSLPYGGTQAWASDFLPGVHQGTRLIPGPDPIPNVVRRLSSAELQQMELGLLQSFNRRHLKRQGPDPLLSARVKSFETAAGMQMEVPEIFDLSGESAETHALYGMRRGQTTGFGWQCLMARRLLEHGVRFIELIDTSSDNLSRRNWDAHTNMGWYRGLAKNVDRPIAGLLKDLKRRGLLDDTLVVWTTEFGRTPFEDGPSGKGRGHWPHAFSSWLAGAGVKGGMIYGRSDEVGGEVVENPVHVHDFHATILHLLGLDHTKLTFRHAGRDYRLTDVYGNVVHDILG